MFKKLASGALLAISMTMATQIPAQPIRLALISEGVGSWPLYVATAKKLFEQQGVTVQTTLTGSSAKQLEELTKGGFDIGFQQSDHVVRGVENGSDLFIFMAQGHAPELSLVVAPTIGAFSDLKGKDIAVDGARSGYALLLRKLFADQGLGNGDYVLKEFGGSKERYDAMKRGAAFATFLNPPFDRNLFAAGFGNLGTTAEYFPTYPGSIAAARRSWAAQNAKQLIAFIRGFGAAYAWLKDTRNKEEAIRLLPARLNMDAEAAARAYDDLVRRPLPEITPEGLRQVIDIVWDAEALKGPKGAVDKYMDLSYLREAAR